MAYTLAQSLPKMKVWCIKVELTYYVDNLDLVPFS